MSEKKSSKKDERTRNWNFILYPDSAPDNWREVIDETRIEWVESPLHDRDINPDGEIKKSHYHVTLLFPTNKSFEQVKGLTDRVNSPIPIKCHSVKGSIRYMVHKDNPEKAQYDWGNIMCHGGVDLNSLCAPTAIERLEIQKDILSYVRSARIIEFEDIVNYAMDNCLTDWLNVLLNYSTLSISTYIRSRRHKAEKGEIGVSGIEIDVDTGEVLSE